MAKEIHLFPNFEIMCYNIWMKSKKVLFPLYILNTFNMIIHFPNSMF